MDKQEYRLKIEKMLKCLDNKSYKEAWELAEDIDWRKVKNASVLCAASEAYEYHGEFERARDILFLAYERAPESKKIIYRLGTLALKMGEIKEAVDCYDEFVALAPNDPNRFIFKYKILKNKKAPLEEQIAALEEFKKVEYAEKWAFELAQLYREAGMITECLEECDDLILWFSEGKYIYQAMELKMQYKPLTPLQHEKYMRRMEVQASSEEPVQEPVEETTKEPAEEVAQEPAEEITEDAAAEEVVQEVLPEEAVQPVEEEVAEETAAEPVVEEPAEEATEDSVEEPAEQPVTQDKPVMSIEAIVQDWQEQQIENAQIIQAEFERAEQEKAQNESEAQEEEEKEEILSDDVRRLMEELEAESAEIVAQKTSQDDSNMQEEDKPLLQKVVEQLSALDVKLEIPGKEVSVPPIAVPVADGIEEIDVPEEDEGIKLGDTQSMALATKALANATMPEVPEAEFEEEEATVREELPPEAQELAAYDTGYVVQGRYDLEAHGDIGTKAGLTEEQKKLFSYFVPVHGMSEQLVQVLEDDRMCKSRYGTSRIGNILIVGRRGSGKTVLAVDLVKAIQKSRRMKQGKVAIVKAEALNKKDIAGIIEKLHGGALVIEKASRLKGETIDTLCELMEGQTDEMLVVLEDERKPIDKMLAQYPNFQKKFTSRIELPVFINDELVTFGQTYAKENGYKIDEMGILALYSDIDILQREEKVVTVADVKAIIDDAIENSKRASVKKLVKKMFGKNRDESDRIILKEEDFR